MTCPSTPLLPAPAPAPPPASTPPAGGGVLTVLLLAFDDMEVLDYAGPYEVFTVAGELASDPAGVLAGQGVPRFVVRSVALTRAHVVGRGGFTVVPDLDLAEAAEQHPAPEVLVVPGGGGSRRLLGEPAVLEWVRAAAAGPGVVASVCTGALVLAAAGLLREGQATTHHGAFEELERLSPTTAVRRGPRFVSVDGEPGGRVWTSGGISAGIDLSLHLVQCLAGLALRAAVEVEMEWGWSGDAR